jgi:hypothetical protein
MVINMHRIYGYVREMRLDCGKVYRWRDSMKTAQTGYARRCRAIGQHPLLPIQSVFAEKSLLVQNRTLK